MGGWLLRARARNISSFTIAALLCAAVSFLVPVGTGHAASVAPQPVGLTTLHYPGDRTADLYIPANLPAKPQLWVMLHGSGQDLSTVENYGFKELADQWGFVVVYPLGWGHVWDAGGCCSDDALSRPDDFAFLETVLADMHERFPGIPANGIKVAGFSNGGMMALSWACRQPEIRGVASVAGVWINDRTCERTFLRVHSIHGVLDQMVPYYGGYSPLLGRTVEAQSALPGHFLGGTYVSQHALYLGSHSWPTGAAQEIWDALH